MRINVKDSSFKTVRKKLTFQVTTRFKEGKKQAVNLAEPLI
jgi:hypothetical protein